MHKAKKEGSKYLRLFLTGFGMGSADIVPGVSGGTVAFIFGIYEELVYSIKKLTGETPRLFLRGNIKKGIASIPFGFLVPLGLGIASALLALASLITYALTHHPVYLWAFFFGLIFASILIVRKRVKSWDTHDIAALLVAAVATFFLVEAVPVETPANPISFFIAGFIAIVAMILPGISGSFLLVLMGKYSQILEAVVARDVLTLGIVMAGAVVGIGIFSRIIYWLFEKHHDIAVAVLTGFMVGSLRKVWPWKETILTRVNSHGEIVPVLENNILPSVNMELLIAVCIMAVGALMLTYLDRMHATREQVKDIDDKEFAQEHQKAISSQKSGKI